MAVFPKNYFRPFFIVSFLKIQTFVSGLSMNTFMKFLVGPLSVCSLLFSTESQSSNINLSGKWVGTMSNPHLNEKTPVTVYIDHQGRAFSVLVRIDKHNGSRWLLSPIKCSYDPYQLPLEGECWSQKRVTGEFVWAIRYQLTVDLTHEHAPRMNHMVLDGIGFVISHNMPRDRHRNIFRLTR